MKARLCFMVLGMVAVMGLTFAPIASSADLIVVATPATFAKNAEWTKFLSSKNIPVKNVAPSDLAAFKDAPYVVLLGAMDETDGIKTLVEKALSKTDLSRVNQARSSAMYVKSDVWSKDQQVIIFTGASDQGFEAARKGNFSEWRDTIFSWFGLETDLGKSGTGVY
jgi:hypothetical protein